jgi:O-antigen ligase
LAGSWWRRDGWRPQLVALAALGLAAVVGVLLAVKITYGLALVFVTGYVLVLLLAPVWALVAFVPLIFLGAVPALNLGGKAAGLFVAAAWIGAALTRRGELSVAIRRRRHLFECLIGLVIWLSLTALWATDPGRTVGSIWYWVSAALLFSIITTWVADEKTLVWFCAAFVAGAVLAVLIGFATGSTGAGAAAAESRLEGGAGDPNFLAAGLVSAMVLAGGVMVTLKGMLTRLGCLVAILICVIGIAATQSRGGIVALFAVAIASLFVFRRRRAYVVVALLAVVAVGAVYFSTTPAAWERVTSPGKDGSGRTDLWSVAWRAFEDHPVAGIGLDNYEVVAKNYVRQPGALESVNKIVEKPHVVHNTYLEMLTEGGVIGLILLLGVAVGCCWAAWQAGKRFEERGEASMESLSRAVFVANVGMLVAIFFLSAGIDRRVWALLALGPACLAIAETRERGDGPAGTVGRS